jgi:hypothetical protein
MIRRLFVSTLVVAGLVALWPSDALAQRGRGPGRPAPRIVISAQWPTIIYPNPWGWGGWGYPYPYQYPYDRYGRRYFDNSADLRIQATPRETEVYVDGSRAGIVDDFDGIFQRLHLTPGDHEITLYLAGFRTWSETRYFGPRSDQRILHTMLQLAPGQPDEPRPMRIQPPRPLPDDRDRDRDRPYDAPPPRNPPPPDRDTRNPPPPPDRPAPERPVYEAPRATGTLSVAIDPRDAEITLDGQKQTIAPGQERFIIQLPEGVHKLVIRKSGYETWETDLQIRRNRTLAFSVSLIK